MLCPSVPIDKNKQGGRNYDASKLTDFKKIGTISKTDTSKVLGINNNRNPQTDTDEQRRASVLIAGLRAVPRAYCPVCPTVAKRPDVLNDALPSATITNLTGITFYVLYYNNTTYSLSYLNNFLYSAYTNSTTNTLLTNANVTGSANWASYKVSLDSVGALPTNASRQDVVNALNVVLNGRTWNTAASKLVASITATGNLILSVSGTQLTSGQLAGLFFGDAPNGSTSLGVTNLNGILGVGGSALMLASGEASVSAPFRIADF